jgi:hypothetical protein
VKEENGKMNSEIGKTAGDIWRLLSKSSSLTIAQIKKALALKDNVLYMALGWLAREDKVEFKTEGRTTKVSLK